MSLSEYLFSREGEWKVKDTILKENTSKELWARVHKYDSHIYKDPNALKILISRR